MLAWIYIVVFKSQSLYKLHQLCFEIIVPTTTKLIDNIQARLVVHKQWGFKLIITDITINFVSVDKWLTEQGRAIDHHHHTYLLAEICHT